MKNLCLLILVLSFSFFISCDSEISELEPQTIETKQVFFPGESSQAESGKKASSFSTCGVTGPSCASPNTTLTYTYNSATFSPNIVWFVNRGDISIGIGEGGNTAYLSFGSDFKGGTITVMGFGPPECSVTLEIPLCSDDNIDPADDCYYALGILDEYIDGTQSGANFVYLYAGGTFPTGTTYEWEIIRQDGTIQFYSPSTSNPRWVSASIDNRITEATVIASFEDCEETANKTFRCAIPNSDINGNLFPECK